MKGTQVIVSGKCSNYPCTVGGWRCFQCVKVLEESYQIIINELHHEHTGERAEVLERRAQMLEMRTVIELANEQIPVLQQKTQEAVNHAAECEAERDKLQLAVQDLTQQLVLAGTETIADRLRGTAFTSSYIMLYRARARERKKERKRERERIYIYTVLYIICYIGCETRSCN